MAVSYIGGGKWSTRRNHRSVKLYHIMLYRVHLAWAWFELTTSVAIGTDLCNKSNYHTVTTMTAPKSNCTNLTTGFLTRWVNKLHLWASWLETGRASIPQINSNLYSEKRIFVWKFSRIGQLQLKGISVWRYYKGNQLKAIAQKLLCLQVDDDRPITYYAVT